MEYRKHTYDSFNIHTIKSDKYKNCHMEIIFRSKVKKEDYTKHLFLFELLLESNKEYDTFSKLAIQCEDMYSYQLNTSVGRTGNYLFGSIIADFINPKYVDESLLENFISFPFSLIFNPNIKGDAWDENSFNITKNKIKQRIASDKERVQNYALNRLRNIMAPDKPISIITSGYMDDLENITKTNIVSFYNYVLRNYYCDVFIYGNLDMNVVTKIILSKNELNSIKTSDLGNIFINIPSVKKVNRCSEYSKITQSIYLEGYTLDNLSDREKNYVLPIFNQIFGEGSLNSKLFTIVREENSLCYSIRSLYMKVDGLLIVYTQIESSSEDKVSKLIGKCLKEMTNGNFTDDDIKNAKSAFINSLNLIFDSESRTIDYYYFKELVNNDSLDKRILEFKSVTKEEIMNVAKKIKLNTTYILGNKGDNNGREN